jgi:hypothetical protein
MHVCGFGRVLDVFLARRTLTLETTSEAAVAFHQLHQVLSREHKAGVTLTLGAPPPGSNVDDKDGYAAMHACLTAVNLGEASVDCISQYDLFRIYLAAAIHFERLESLPTSLVATYYLRHVCSCCYCCSSSCCCCCYCRRRCCHCCSCSCVVPVLLLFDIVPTND